jgi:acyl-CoA thioesterase-1
MLRALLTMILLCSAATAAEPGKTILVFGDSLSAGYGISVGQGWVALLQQRLAAQGYGYRVVNASISGETTSGGSARLPQAIGQNQPAIVILELGANDGLRGLPMQTVQSNLENMLATIRKSGAKPLLVGVQLPPNYGARYAEQHTNMYKQIAAKQKVALAPSLMLNVGLAAHLMQNDGLHPNANGQPLLLENIWPHLKPLLERR